MPHIAVNVSKSLTYEEKITVKTRIGELITILPGKSEKSLMVEINDNVSLFYGGKEGNLAFIDVRLYKPSPLEAKAELTKEIFKMLEKEIGVDPDSSHLNFIEMPIWGTKGVLK